MDKVTHILAQIEQGDASAAEALLPMVYAELRVLAAARLARERPGQTLQATALVHEAYLRLVDAQSPREWDSRGHFFSAAAESMRRILVENARRKGAEKHGGGRVRRQLKEQQIAAADEQLDLLELDEALTRLAAADPEAAELVKLRYFAGLTMHETAEALGISPRKAYYTWTYARTWLHRAMREE